MKIKILRKRNKKLATPSTPLTILTGVIVALAATAGALFAKLRAAADPEKRAIREIIEGTDRLKNTIERTPDSTLRGSAVLQEADSRITAIRQAVEEHAANGTTAPAPTH